MRYVSFLSVFLLFVNCTSEPTKTKVVPTPEPKSDIYYIKRIERDINRKYVLDKAKAQAGKVCKGDEDCEDICDDIYSSRRERNDCEELSITQVNRFEGIYETLEDSDEDDLQDIDVSKDGDFDVFINVSIEPLHKLVGKYSSREAKDFLAWIANNKDVAELLENEDDDYEVLERLLGRLGASDNLFEALKKNLDGGDTFIDLAVTADNEVALEWIYEYLEEKDSNCKLDTDAGREACLESYCGLAGDIEDDNANHLLGYDFFEGYIEDIIEDKINADPDTNDGAETPDCNIPLSNPVTLTYTIATCPSGVCEISGCNGRAWDADPNSDNQIEDIDDLDDWWTDLC